MAEEFTIIDLKSPKLMNFTASSQTPGSVLPAPVMEGRGKEIA
jgi:hypothetical protein